MATPEMKKSPTEEVDENVDEQLLDVISRSKDFETQQRTMERIAATVPEVTVARRLYSVFFPTADGVTRRAG